MGRKARRVVREDEVLGIFQMKANGKSGVDIADAIGCSDSQISRILHRDQYPDVEVPQHLIDTVNKMLIKRRSSPKATKRTQKALNAEAQAVSDYTHACYSLVAAESKCREAGVDQDVLSNLLHVITKQRHL